MKIIIWEKGGVGFEEEAALSPINHAGWIELEYITLFYPNFFYKLLN